MAKHFGELIYTKETKGEAAAKAETHTPKIEAPKEVRKGEPFKIRISVGPHPNQPTHSIRSIEVWFYEEGRSFNPVRIAIIEFEPGYADPDVELTIRLEKSGVLYALSYCNLHGIWENRVEIKVIE